VLLALICTLLSLVIHGTRGGLPGADVYGWPKEFLLAREGDSTFNGLYFFIDLCFYFVLAAGVGSVKNWKR
jgi:hypothetical protein